MGFALNYDINHWLRDLNDKCLYGLWRDGQIRWEDYWIQWAPGRWFHVKHLPSGRSVRIWDSFSFFGVSFLRACADWEIPVPADVVEGKEKRHEFGPADLPRIIAYNAIELRLVAQLLGKLKDALYSAGIPLDQWYGAGAIATKLLSLHGAKERIVQTPPEVANAALGAFFGGRIEAGCLGRISGPISNLDVRSAYPDAMRYLPNLARGQWVRGTSEAWDPIYPFLHDFSLYRIEWEFPKGWQYYPLPWRERTGAIYFPRVGRGWYWGPEVEAAERTAAGFGGSVRVLERWHFVPNEDGFHDLAFPWVPELFERRRKVGPKTGEGRVIKLGINALYGKLAQREGIFTRTPTYRQFEYSGFITSYVRARLWIEAWGQWSKVIAFATDGIYSLGVLERPASFPREDHKELGEWEATSYDAMDIVMPGVYRLLKPDGSWELFGRGFGKTGIPWSEVIEGWRQGKTELTVRVPRFHGLGECIHVQKGKVWIDREKWRSWADAPKEIKLRNASVKRLEPVRRGEGMIATTPYDPQFGAAIDSTPHEPRRSVEDESDPIPRIEAQVET